MDEPLDIIHGEDNLGLLPDIPTGPPTEEDKALYKSDSRSQPLSSKGKMVCRMHVAGLRTKDIASALGLQPSYVSWVLECDEATPFIEALQKEVDRDFQQLMNKVVNTCRKALDSQDLQMQLKGAEFWAKYSGRFEQTVKVNLSAEDIVKQLLSPKEAKDVTPIAALPESHRELIHDSGQERGDSTIHPEQCPEGHRLDPDI